MKKVLNILFLFLLFQSSAQTTAIPDPIFEQVLIDLGYDSGPVDGSVPTASIDTISFLNIGGHSISDLTGLQDFSRLRYLNCADNLLTSLDISQNKSLRVLYCYWNTISNLDLSQNDTLNTLYCGSNPLNSLNVSTNDSLEILNCFSNQLSTLDLSNNLKLKELSCNENQLTSLDISNNVNLEMLYCAENLLSTIDISNNLLLDYLNIHTNQISNLDVSQHEALEFYVCNNNLFSEINVSNNQNLVTFQCTNNQLHCLNVGNGNNVNFINFWTDGNPDLYCVEVDDAQYSTTNWPGSIEPWMIYSDDCNNSCSLAIFEPQPENKELMNIVDIMGIETEYKPNTLLIYIYDDGTMEKVYIIE